MKKVRRAKNSNLSTSMDTDNPFIALFEMFEEEIPFPEDFHDDISNLLKSYPFVVCNTKLYQKYRENGDSIPISIYKSGFHFPFNPSILRKILLGNYVFSKYKYYVSMFVLQSYLSWICLYDKIKRSDFTDLILMVLLRAASFEYKDVAIQAFIYAYNMLMDDSILITEHQVNILRCLYTTFDEYPNSCYKLIVKALGKLITPVSKTISPETTIILNDIINFCMTDHNVFDADDANRLIDLIIPVLYTFNDLVLKCFAQLMHITQTEDFDGIYSELAVQIFSLIKEIRLSVPWPSGGENKKVSIGVPDVMDTVFQFHQRTLFQKGLEINVPVFSHSISFSNYYDRRIAEILNLIISSMDHHPNYALIFTNEMYSYLNKNARSSNIGIYYTHFSYYCTMIDKKIHSIILFPGILLLQSELFDPSITIFNKPNDFEIVDILRNITIMLLISEGETSLNDIFVNFKCYPYLYAEILYRLSILTDDLSKLILKDNKAINFLNNTLVFFLSQPNENQELAELVLNAYFHLLSTLLENATIECKLFGEVYFLQPFLLLFFEESIREYAITKFEHFLKTQDIQTTSNAYYSLSSVIASIQLNLTSTQYINLMIDIIKMIDHVNYISPIISDLIFTIISEVVPSRNSKMLILELLWCFTKHHTVFVLNDKNVSIIIKSIQHIYEGNYDDEIFNCLIQMLGGNQSEWNTLEFEIVCENMLTIIFITFLETKYFDNLIEIMIKLNHFSASNRTKMHEVGIDKLLIEYMKLHKNDQRYIEKLRKLLKLLKLVVIESSSPSIVKEYISLLNPINIDGEKRLLFHQFDFAKCLLKFLMPNYLNGSKFQDVKKLNFGKQQGSFYSDSFTILFWILVDTKDAQSFDIIEFKDFFNIKVIDGFFAISNNKTNVNANHGLYLFSFSIIISNDELLIHPCINLEQEEIIRTSNFHYLELVTKKQRTKSCMIEISYIYIYDELNESEVSKIYHGVGINKYPIIISSSEEMVLNTSGFSYSLINLWRSELIFPLFTLFNIPLIDGSYWENCHQFALNIFTKITLTSTESQVQCVKYKHFYVISGILFNCPNEKITFGLYKQFYELYLLITYDDAKKDLFNIILSNLDLWIVSSEIILIIDHWLNHLMQSCYNLVHFSKILNSFQLFVWKNVILDCPLRQRNKSIDIDEIKVITKGCLLFSAHQEFTLLDFNLIFAHCSSCNDINNSRNLLLTLNELVTNSSSCLKNIGLTSKEMSCLHMLVRLNDEDITINIIQIITQIYKNEIIEGNDLSNNIYVIIQLLPVKYTTHSFFQRISSMLINNHEVLGICCWYCLSHNDEKSIYELIAILDSLQDFNTTDPIFFLWPIILAIKKELIHGCIVKFLYTANKKKWPIILHAIDIICVAIGENPNLIKYNFLSQVCFEVMTQNGINEKKVSKCINETMNYIFYKPKCKGLFNPLLYQIYQESPYFDSSKKEKKRKKKLQMNDIYKAIFNANTSILSEMIFSLKLLEDGTWFDFNLAKMCLQIIQKSKKSNFHKYEVLIGYYINKIDENFNNRFGIKIPEHIDPYYLDKPQVMRSHEKADKIIKEQIEEISKFSKIIFNNDHEEIFGKSFSMLKSMGNNYIAVRKQCQALWNDLYENITRAKCPWDSTSFNKKEKENYKRETCHSSDFCLYKTSIIHQHVPNPIDFKPDKHIKYQCSVILIKVSKEIAFELYFCKKNIVLYKSDKQINIRYSDIKSIFLRTRFHYQTALEMFLINGKSYLLNTQSKMIRDELLAQISQRSKKYLKTIQTIPNVAYFRATNYQQLWTEGKISNFTYLLYLNIYSGRTFNDLTQYPIFPLIENRELSKPLDMPLKPDVIVKYMKRVEPFASHKANPVTGNNELIPEFYYFPEIFNDEVETMYINRKRLESDEVSRNLNEWIDIIWGVKQDQTNSPKECFDNVWESQVNCENQKIIESEMTVYGVYPSKLFDELHPRRVENALPAYNSMIGLKLCDNSIVFAFFKYVASKKSPKIEAYALTSSGKMYTISISVYESIINVSAPADVPLKNDIDSNSLFASVNLNTLLISTQTSINVYNIEKQESFNIESPHNKLLSMSSSGIYISTSGNDSLTNVYQIKNDLEKSLGKPCFSIHSYNDMITCSEISESYQAQITGTMDGSLLISSTKKKSLTRVIDLETFIPHKVMITKAFGFIVTYSVETKDGILSYYLTTHTINGIIVRKTQINSKITNWANATSQSGFDYVVLAMPDSQGKDRLFICEAFYLNLSRIDLKLTGKAVALQYNDEMNSLFVIDSNSLLYAIPIILDK